MKKHQKGTRLEAVHEQSLKDFYSSTLGCEMFTLKISNEPEKHGTQEMKEKYKLLKGELKGVELGTCSSKQCLCFSDICLRRACFSFNKLSKHNEPQSSFSSSHRDLSWKTTCKTLYDYVNKFI